LNIAENVKRYSVTASPPDLGPLSVMRTLVALPPTAIREQHHVASATFERIIDTGVLLGERGS
jgi:hypothetical protein